MKILHSCAQEVKTAVATHEADHDNGPFGHAQQQTTKLIMQIELIELQLPLYQVDCCLVVALVTAIASLK
jgi:hypothetical protein